MGHGWTRIRAARTAVTARSERKCLSGRGLGSVRGKNYIKKRSRVGPAQVRVEDVKQEDMKHDERAEGAREVTAGNACGGGGHGRRPLLSNRSAQSGPYAEGCAWRTRAR